jgi:hypothetical protein
MLPMRALVSFGVLLSFAALPQAVAVGLAWQSDTLVVDADPDQQQVRAEFSFHNDGDRPITIKSVTPTCGCTTASLGKKTYAVGESGKIQVVFTIGGRTGLQEKYIMVQTDDPRRTEPIELLLRINIHSYVDFEPHVLFWGVGSDATEKTITCTALLPSAVVLAEARSTNPAIITRIETVEPGRKYHLHVKPASTATEFNATIPLSFTITGAHGSQKRSFDAFACVTKPIEVHQSSH